MNATDEGQSKLDQLANNEDINSIKYFSSKGNNEAQISYNDNTGQYIYTESQDDSNSLLMIVDDEKYQVILLLGIDQQFFENKCDLIFKIGLSVYILKTINRTHSKLVSIVYLYDWLKFNYDLSVESDTKFKNQINR